MSAVKCARFPCDKAYGRGSHTPDMDGDRQSSGGPHCVLPFERQDSIRLADGSPEEDSIDLHLDGFKIMLTAELVHKLIERVEGARDTNAKSDEKGVHSVHTLDGQRAIGA
jgi:hypothetical protein